MKAGVRFGFGYVGYLGGRPVVETTFLPWMRPLMGPSRVILAREAADVPARLAWDGVKAAMRADLEAALDGFADQVGVGR